MVLMASAEGIGKSNTEAIMEAMGGKGEFAIVSCGETADQLNQWIAEIKKFTEANYPEATVVDTVFAGEDVAKATQMATDLMNAHPKLTGIVGTCSTAGPGIAQAVENAGKIGTVFTVGMGTPNDMAKYLKSGAASANSMKAVPRWSRARRRTKKGRRIIATTSGAKFAGRWPGHSP